MNSNNLGMQSNRIPLIIYIFIIFQLLNSYTTYPEFFSIVLGIMYVLSLQQS